MNLILWGILVVWCLGITDDIKKIKDKLEIKSDSKTNQKE